MGAGHARSRYLNRKEGGAEGMASDWSEVVTSFKPKAHELIILGRNKLIGSPFTPPCPSRVAAGGRKKEREGWGFSRFWLGIAGPQQEARTTAISSVVERALIIASLCLGCEGSQPHG
ncbi:hypothetical protein Bca101_036518 [Brassica carinata]